MSSLDIAAVTGKPHKDVLKAIRTMEPAWEKECGRNFSLTSEKVKMPQGGVRLIPEHSGSLSPVTFSSDDLDVDVRSFKIMPYQIPDPEKYDFLWEDIKTVPNRFQRFQYV